mmetsp:Transcript_78395/g.162869  ORF Transcript_78395/g.162869 Transcript_78395/m.162869 type:complete len:212 (+) Transcript_78395:1062-1697(+)
MPMKMVQLESSHRLQHGLDVLGSEKMSTCVEHQSTPLEARSILDGHLWNGGASCEGDQLLQGLRAIIGACSALGRDFHLAILHFQSVAFVDRTGDDSCPRGVFLLSQDCASPGDVQNDAGDGSFQICRGGRRGGVCEDWLQALLYVRGLPVPSNKARGGPQHDEAAAGLLHTDGLGQVVPQRLNLKGVFPQGPGGLQMHFLSKGCPILLFQ